MSHSGTTGNLILNLTEGGLNGALTTVESTRNCPFSAKSSSAYSGKSGQEFCENGKRNLHALIRSTTVNTFFVSKELIVLSFDFFPWYSAHTV